MINIKEKAIYDIRMSDEYQEEGKWGMKAKCKC
jgi:hypothetical protein